MSEDDIRAGAFRRSRSKRAPGGRVGTDEHGRSTLVLNDANGMDRANSNNVVHASPPFHLMYWYLLTWDDGRELIIADAEPAQAKQALGATRYRALRPSEKHRLHAQYQDQIKRMEEMGP